MAEQDTITLPFEIQDRYADAGKRVGKAKEHRPTKRCQHEGCERWAWAQGYCDSHYQKLKRIGVIKNVRTNIGDPVARFNASYEINPTTGCWEWTGWIHPKGYGILGLGGNSKKIRAHRFSWELHHGPIPDGLHVLHTCDNRKCCNISHLFLGDDGDNARDCVQKGRHGSQQNKPRLKITPPMAMNIRIMFARGELSMTKLAALYGVDQRTISNIINGRSHLNVR